MRRTSRRACNSVVTHLTAYPNPSAKDKKLISCLKICTTTVSILNRLDEKEVLQNIEVKGIYVFHLIQRATLPLRQIQHEYRNTPAHILFTKNAKKVMETAVVIEKTVLAAESLISTKARFAGISKDRLQHLGEHQSIMADRAAMIFIVVESRLKTLGMPGKHARALLKLFVHVGRTLVAVGAQGDICSGKKVSQEDTSKLGQLCLQSADAIRKLLEKSRDVHNLLARGHLEWLQGLENQLRSIALASVSASAPQIKGQEWLEYFGKTAAIDILINVF
jgi:hypothetical protein